MSSGAFAADLAPRTYTKAPIMSPVTNWSGFYGGVNVGYGWGDNNMSFEDATSIGVGSSGVLPQSLGTSSAGVIGGGQIGYNWQSGPFVAGLETDFQGTGIKGTATRSPIATDFTLTASANQTETFVGTFEQKLSWFGTVRGRFGAAVSPVLFLYGTGGLAYGRVSNSGNAVDTFQGVNPGVTSYPAVVAQTKVGWAAGAGAEWMFAHNWSAKVEYLHIDLGTTPAIGSQVDNGVPERDPTIVAYHWRNSFDTVRAGVNYHFN
jgi:outer membrane immunogenic protein